MTGPNAAVGVRALRGVLVAVKVFEDGREYYPPITVAVRDTQGTPEGAGRAVTELVRDEGAIVIVGPLTSSEAPGAAHTAERLQVPIVTLTQREEIVAVGENVFRSILTPKDEARAVANYAARRLLVSRFAILLPDDAFGRDLAQAFTEEVLRGGGRVTKRASYRAPFDIPATLPQLFDRTADGGMAAPWDAIFVPDDVFAARIAAGRLRERGLKHLKLLGTGLWNTPDALQSDALEGAVFAAAFSEADPGPRSRDFASAYRRTFDGAPDAVAAQAHDVAALITRILQAGSPVGPAHMRERLQVTSGIEGAAGTLRFEGARNARIDALVLGVRKGRIVPLSSRSSGAGAQAAW